MLVDPRCTNFQWLVLQVKWSIKWSYLGYGGGCPSPVLVQTKSRVWIFFMSRFWSGTRSESGLGLDKIQISVSKLLTWKNRKLNSKNSKNRKILKIEKFKKIENLKKMKIWKEIWKYEGFQKFKIWNFKTSNFQIFDFWFFRNFVFFNFQFLIFSKFYFFKFKIFSIFQFQETKSEFCPDQVQTRIWFWSGPDKIQIWVWTRKIPDSGRNLD